MVKLSVPRYWRELGSYYRLEGIECRDCGRRSYPPSPACPHCGSRNVRRVELPKTGRLLSHTVIYSVPEGFREYAPLILGLVELDDGTRLIAQITDASPDEVRQEMRLEAVLRRTQVDGNYGLIYYG
ncbi:MAG: Zn-ribbon domain-containing OB-fold protein, partial [Candidatus Korarchaeota archaeon]|nr:Zn-ribbon domain-containing OB-fold protein [Candidatus Korarchaeota archaeon]